MHRRRVGGAMEHHPLFGHHPIFAPPPPMNIVFGSSHPHLPYHPHPNLAQIAAQTIHIEMDAERLRLEAERAQAEARANEERRRFDDARRREAQALLEAQQRERSLQWEKEEAVLAERRRQEETERRKREAKQRVIEAALAEERRIQAQKEADESRVLEQKRLASLQIMEDQEETQRLSIYDAHRSLITKVSELEFLELQQQVTALAPLTNPIPRYQETHKKGIPLAPDGKTTLFFSILNSKKFDNATKYHLVQLLIDTKGYSEYFNLLLSSPILELLVIEAQPKPLPAPNEQGVIILPDQFSVLNAVFQHAVKCRMQFDKPVEQQIYPALILLGLGMDIFNYHYEQRTANETMQFLVYWRSFNDVSHAHQNLLSTYKEMKEDFYQLLKADFMSLQFNPPLYASNLEVFTKMVIAAGMTKERITLLLNEWCPLITINDVSSFMDVYANLLTLIKKEDCLGINDTYITKILQINEEIGKQLYERLKFNKVSTTALMWILKCWVAAFKAPHDFSVVKHLYFELIKEKSAELAHEDKVWEGLIRGDASQGLELFKYLIDNNSSKTKLMRYMDVWMDVLPNDEAIREVYYKIKPFIQNSSLRDFRFPIRTIAEINTVKLIPEKRIIVDEQSTKKFLRVTRPGFFGISCSNAHSSFRAYEEVRMNVQAGKPALEHERELAEQEINQQLVAAGEEGAFKFRA